MRLAWAEEDRSLSFFDRGGEPPEAPQFFYTERADGSLELEGTFEGKETRMVLRRSEEGALLLERGYRWINEYPFNR